MKLVPYLIRPHSILSASLWDYWYRSHIFKEIFGFTCTDSFLYAIPAGDSYVVHAYKREGDIRKLRNRARELLIQFPAECLRMLQEGCAMQKDILESRYNTVLDIKEEYAKVAIYTAILPYFWFNQSDTEYTVHHNDIQKLCRVLRSKNVYSIYYDTVVSPCIQSMYKCSKEIMNLHTYMEVESGQEKRRSGYDMGFEYICSNATERLTFLSYTDVLQKIGTLKNIPNTTHVYCSGINSSTPDIYGTARIVANDISIFKDGEILVVSSMDDRYIPLCSRASAILCEEGGVAAHVSYIKDIQVPVLTCVKDITVRIKSGDKILVEPSKFRVRLLHE